MGDDGWVSYDMTFLVDVEAVSGEDDSFVWTSTASASYFNDQPGVFSTTLNASIGVPDSA